MFRLHVFEVFDEGQYKTNGTDGQTRQQKPILNGYVKISHFFFSSKQLKIKSSYVVAETGPTSHGSGGVS